MRKLIVETTKGNELKFEMPDVWDDVTFEQFERFYTIRTKEPTDPG